MKFDSSQDRSGISFIGLLFVVGVLACLACWAAQVFPTVVEYQAILKAVQKATAGNTVPEVRQIFDKAAADRRHQVRHGQGPRHLQGRRQGGGEVRLQQGNPHVRPRLPAAEVRRAIEITKASVDGQLVALQARLQHQFSDPQLLARALTHRSFSADHNERLEFLGDSVLNLAVAALLYERLQALPEGDLSRVRANLVKQDTLHQLAVGARPAGAACGWARARSRSGGSRRPSILADALEALIGAVYLDAGYRRRRSAGAAACSQDVEINPTMAATAKDPKTELQEWLQGRKMKLPVYRVAATLGAAHKQTFDVECEIAELGAVERGIGASRRAGEQAAAAAMLLALKAKEK